MAERGPERLLLDTHAWLWLVSGTEGMLLPAACAAAEAASRTGDVLVSAISVWEVGMLDAKGRISLTMPVDEWVRRALRATGVQLVALTPEIALDSTRLPGEPPGDHADRILIATARLSDARLLTRDARIVQYAQGGYVRVLDATP